MTNVYYLSDCQQKPNSSPSSHTGGPEKRWLDENWDRLKNKSKGGASEIPILAIDNLSPPQNIMPSNDSQDKRHQIQAQLLHEAVEARRHYLEVAARLKPPAPDINELASAKPILLFHVSTGRNAWHSTWVARYQRETLQISRQNAVSFVWDRLTQGTVFRLLITPGWHLQFDRKAYLVCEINTTNPFSRLRNAAFAVPGVTERDALAMLSPRSELWRGDAPHHDSVIVQETKAAASACVPWGDRTTQPSQKLTPGRYKRDAEVDGVCFKFAETAGQPGLDVSAFEAVLAGQLPVNDEGQH